MIPQPRSGGGRVHEQVQLVEQFGVEQLAHDRHRPAQSDALGRRVLLQRGDGLDEVVVELLAVAPVELERTARGDDLAHVAELFGERGIRLAGGLAVGPCSGEAVVGDAAEEHDADVMGTGHGSGHLVVKYGKCQFPTPGSTTPSRAVNMLAVGPGHTTPARAGR